MIGPSFAKPSGLEIVSKAGDDLISRRRTRVSGVSARILMPIVTLLSSLCSIASNQPAIVAYTRTMRDITAIVRHGLLAQMNFAPSGMLGNTWMI